MSYIKSGILAGIVLFIWTAISWMILPWHMDTLNSFQNENAVVEVIKANAPRSGVYFLPTQETPSTEQAANQPLVFSSIHLEGMAASMTVPMIISLIGEILAATLVAWLLTKTRGLTYFQRVKFVMIFAIAASIVTHLPYWNWFFFSTAYSLTLFADLLIGWFLAGLVLAKFSK